MFYYGVGAGPLMGGLNKCIVCVDKETLCPLLGSSPPSPPRPPSFAFVLLNKPLLLIVLFSKTVLLFLF